ncbi:MAG TPA: glycine zipper 2TM domain-containing protein [Caldimonas sp.]
MSTETIPVAKRALSRWLAAAVGAATMFAALTLSACSPSEQTAGAATAQTVPATTAVPADAARDGTPVPPAPTAALAPAPAVAPPPAPVQPSGYAAAPMPGPATNVDDQVRSAPAARDPRVAGQAVPSGRLGSVESIDPIRKRPQGTGAGAVIGGVAGAVIGNQFGSGLGRAAMTGLGAAGGAVAGNNVERNIHETVVGYRIHVRLDDGHTRVFERSQLGNLHVGDRIRVDGSSFHRV